MRKIVRTALFVSILPVLIACSLAPLQPQPATLQPETGSATVTPTLPIVVTQTVIETPTELPGTSSVQQCAYNWATRPLPEESAHLQQAVEAAGITGVTGRAEAYGENCTAANGTIVSFSTMETDFRFADKVTDSLDRDAMGKQVQALIQIVEAFPEGTFPGPQKGYIGVTFQKGGEEVNLWFQRIEAQAALKEGLQGEALFKRLRHEG